MAENDRNVDEQAESIETTGRSIEEAVKRALLQLNATLDDVDISVIDGGASRLLPSGGRPAKVRVTRRLSPYSAEEEESDDEPAEPPPRPQAPPREPVHRTPRVESEATAAEPAAPRGSGTLLESGEELAETAYEIVTGLLERMGFVASVEQTSDDPLTLNVIGEEDLSHLIGERGEMLRTFGYLVNLMVGRRLERPCRVIVDVDHYREHRAAHLAELAQTLADEVRETQEPVTLEAMPARERRLVHVALADDADVRTYSIGEGDDRRVVISPKA